MKWNWEQTSRSASAAAHRVWLKLSIKCLKVGVGRIKSNCLTRTVFLVAEIREEDSVFDSYWVVLLFKIKNNCLLFLSQAHQKDVTEIDILVKNQGILRHSNYTLPLEESMLYSISRDSDTLFTLPNLSKKGIFKRPLFDVLRKLFI